MSKIVQKIHKFILGEDIRNTTWIKMSKQDAQELIKQAKLEAVIEYVESCKSMQCNPDRKREAIKSEIEKE